MTGCDGETAPDDAVGDNAKGTGGDLAGSSWPRGSFLSNALSLILCNVLNDNSLASPSTSSS
eukprot:CAMPEP_0197060112 /NCGR_PEP_ID=MMETSP1384-20130603/124150_1 /TAXON_ID=29189 /ORGANISM="Ammonia sp." /LENGTH=61 /DNA_ID=CAMNT_0042495387 /DNA_START=46 /DNA_END=227 /DNA_ORIENTATION=+